MLQCFSSSARVYGLIRGGNRIYSGRGLRTGLSQLATDGVVTTRDSGGGWCNGWGICILSPCSRTITADFDDLSR